MKFRILSSEVDEMKLETFFRKQPCFHCQSAIKWKIAKNFDFVKLSSAMIFPRFKITIKQIQIYQLKCLVSKEQTPGKTKLAFFEALL